MSFSKEWDFRYKNNTNMSIWPWSDLVSYVMRYAPPDKHDFQVLELGCGAGANIPFFESLGVKYFAMEGSETIVNSLKQKFPRFKKKIIIGDFTETIPFQNHFDLVVDRSSLTHNTTKGIKRCLDLIYEKLKNGGKYIGIDWFSTLHSEYGNGITDDDFFTKKNYTSGQFVNVGKVHFSDKSHITELLNRFDILVLEHKVVRTEIPNENKVFASWNIVVQKNI